MTTATMLAIFEDFNDTQDEPAPPAPEDQSSAIDEIGQIRKEAWTDGYLAGRQEGTAVNRDQTLMARLLTSVDEWESKTSGAVESAAMIVADLLVNTVITVISDEWAPGLLERVRMVAGQITPALTVAPEFVVHDAGGAVRRFGDISELSRALDGGDIDQDVSIRWQRGEATISRTALLEDLRNAIIPLTAGLNQQQTTRQHS